MFPGDEETPIEMEIICADEDSCSIEIKIILAIPIKRNILLKLKICSPGSNLRV